MWTNQVALRNENKTIRRDATLGSFCVVFTEIWNDFVIFLLLAEPWTHHSHTFWSEHQCCIWVRLGPWNQRKCSGAGGNTSMWSQRGLPGDGHSDLIQLWLWLTWLTTMTGWVSIVVSSALTTELVATVPRVHQLPFPRRCHPLERAAAELCYLIWAFCAHVCSEQRLGGEAL